MQRIAIACLIAMLGLGVARAESILNRGHHDEPESLDPDKTDGTQEIMIESDLFEGLVRINAAGGLSPGVASHWETSADGLTWTFHLLPNLVWSDGSKLTANDFVYSFRRALDPATASPYAEPLYVIAGAQAFAEGKTKDASNVGISAPDDDTVLFHLRQPTPYFLGILAVEVAFPLPRKVIEAHGTKWTQPGNLVSNGPFTLESWTPHLDVVLKRNPRYHDAASVKLDGVRWVVVEEDDTSLRRYRGGELDIARVPPQDVPMLRREMPDQLHTDTILRTDFLVLNVTKPPFDDVRVRQALAMSLDRSILADKVNPHGQKPAEALVPPGIAGYQPQPPDWASWSMSERRAKAKTLLAAAGYGPDHRLSITVAYPTGDGTRFRLGAIAQMWKPLGVDLTLDNQENGVFNAALRDHQEQMAYTDWVADFADPQTFLAIMDSRNPQENSALYHSPAFEALLDQAATTLNQTARFALLEQAEAIANHDAAVIPIIYESIPMVVSPRVKGYTPNPLDDVPSRDLWLEPNP